jgi:arylsulfatase A
MHLRTTEITLARLLQRAGYATCLVGKWHLSGGFDLAGQPTPADHGFDHWFATQNVAVPSHRDPENFYRNGKALGKLAGYSAAIVAREAADWLANKRDKEKPFFLLVGLHEPHEKIATDPRFAELYPSPMDPSRAEFWGNISQLDDAFGRLMKTIEELKLADNTLVFFTSDNGAALTQQHPHGSTGGLRGKKSQVYEGGVRVPGLLRWPGKIRPGQVSEEPVSGIDVLPTLCPLAKVALPADRAIDGASFLPVLDGKPVVRKTPLYWQFHRADSKHKVAMRVGAWKLYATLTGPQLASSGDILQDDLDSLNHAQLDSFALYHLGKDREETNDLALTEKQRVAEMADTMRSLFRAVCAESPRWPIWRRFPAKAPE